MLMPKAFDLKGMRFGSLICIEKAPSQKKKTYWKCRCDCGKEIIVQTCHLRDGRTKSCGCHINFKLENNQNLEAKQCILCNNDFITDNFNRKYCYDCIPSGLTQTESIKRKDRLLKHKLVEYKGGKCEKCGYNKCEGALHFHHINPDEKDFTISHTNLSNHQNLDYFFFRSR